MIQFRDREIANEQLVLDSRTELHYLGPTLTLRNCTLIVKVPAKALVVSRTRLIDCSIEVARVLKNFSWDRAHFSGCRFKGRYLGNGFGNLEGTAEGSIVDCDFTDALLDETRFLNCDARTMSFPPWPGLTILDPVGRAAELVALPWPGELRDFFQWYGEERPASTAAVTYFVPDLAKRNGTTPEAIKAVLEQLDGVYY
ncbi:pentapeptide repeat-containing protein [Hyalangium versicolor]|uniref:pentapeptide repeat-containing protein n=1 Tax=Hyalangium versicolor TaxID=2861190 RepID=UPI001CCBA762|nr:pentapeptide repeat-containing protein [Hyalangium versicolor]